MEPSRALVPASRPAPGSQAGATSCGSSGCTPAQTACRNLAAGGREWWCVRMIEGRQAWTLRARWARRGAAGCGGVRRGAAGCGAWKGASERSLARVGAHVRAEIEVQREALAAPLEGAEVRPLPRVRERVSLQFRAVEEPFAAPLARQRRAMVRGGGVRRPATGRSNKPRRHGGSGLGDAPRPDRRTASRRACACASAARSHRERPCHSRGKSTRATAARSVSAVRCTAGFGR